MKHLVLVLAMLCAGCGTLNQQYVEADRADFDIFAPMIRVWLTQEPGVALDPYITEPEDYIDILELKLRSREARIEAAEKLLLEQE